MKKFLLMIIVLSLVGAGCEVPQTSETNQTEYKSQTQNAVEAQGFTDVKMGMGSKSPIFACSDSDSWVKSDSFTAKNINNVEVQGVVCCGWFKGCTVRF